MNALVTWFFNAPRQTREIGWFRNGLYVFLLYKALVYACHFRTLFSDKAMVYTWQAFPGGIKNLPFLLNNHYSKGFAIGCLLLVAALALMGLCRRAGYLGHLLLWLLVLNLNSYLYATLTAGDYLLNQLLFFNIFLSAKQQASGSFNELKTALHHMALAGIKVQVCLAYLLAAWFKLTDAAWLDGSAVHHIFQVPDYTNGLLMSLPLWLCVILNYATMAYQLLFPLLIWLRPFKVWLMAFGILQHLLIAFCMGLFCFGMLMILCYILFLRYDEGRPAAQSPAVA